MPHPVLTPRQRRWLAACAAALRPPARAVAAGPGAAALAALLREAVPAGVHAHEDGDPAPADAPLDLLVVVGGGDAVDRLGARVVPGGTLLLLAAGTTGEVAEAVRSVAASPRWRFAERDGALAEFTRVDLPPGDRLLSIAGQFPWAVGRLAASLRRP